MFHCACVMEWIARSAVCPVCKRKVSIDGVVTALGRTRLAKVAPLKRKRGSRGRHKSSRADMHMLDQHTISSSAARVLTQLQRDERQVALSRLRSRGGELGPAARSLALEIEVLGPRHTPLEMFEPELQRWFGVHASSALARFMRGHRGADGDVDEGRASSAEAAGGADDEPAFIDINDSMMPDQRTVAELAHDSVRGWEYRAAVGGTGFLVDGPVSEFVSSLQHPRMVLVPLPTAYSQDAMRRPFLGVAVLLPLDCVLRWLPHESASRIELAIETHFVNAQSSFDGSITISSERPSLDSERGIGASARHSSGGAIASIAQALQAVSRSSSSGREAVQVSVLPAELLGLKPRSNSTGPAFDMASLGITLL